uniref:Nuclear receptor domain-containing protein n=1 Tax=Strongyloides stercoralis TaxID=6248 RepID=A0A0K0EK64_STRER
MNEKNLNVFDLNNDRCLVCNALSKGVHNKCRSCRACAAFYKRAVVFNASYKCKKGNYQCIIDYSKKILCKACRFRKCKDIGMVLKRSVSGIDKSEDEMSVEGYKTKAKNRNENNNLNLLTNLDISLSINSFSKNIPVNLNDIVYQIKKIFNQNSFFNENILLVNSTCLKNTTKAINKFCNSLKMNSYNMMPEPNMEELQRNILFWKKFIILTAEMLIEIPEFSTLHYQNKIQIFRHFWPFWFVLFRVWRAIEVFGPNMEFPCAYLDDNGFVKLIAFNDTNSNLSHDDIEKVAKHLNPLITYLADYIYTPLKSVNPSIDEIAYLAIQNLFITKSMEKFSTTFYERNKILLATSSNELHDYYITTKKNDNYVQRVTNLMKVFFSISRFIEQANEYSIIGKILEIYQCNIFKSEIAPSIVV